MNEHVETPAPETHHGNNNPQMTPQIDEPTAQNEKVSVNIVRSVRFGRLLIVGAGVGGLLAVMFTLLRPVDPEALYGMRQIVGYMLVMGAAIGLGCGGFLALLLHFFAKRKRGSGVAIHTDVQ